MVPGSSFCIAALLSLVPAILGAPPILPAGSSSPNSLTLPLNISSINLGAQPLPPYPPPDPLAYQVPNTPILLVFTKYLTQRRDETWAQRTLALAHAEAAQHQPAEAMQNRVYTWAFHTDLVVKPAAEEGGRRRLTWGLWNNAIVGIHDFLNKYDNVGQPGVGLRMNFEILLREPGIDVDGLFALGKGYLMRVI